VLFDEYMTRPRFIDEAKETALVPETALGEQDFKGDFLSSVGAALGQNCVIADLNAELYYKPLLKAWPDAQFCFVMRDPRDCIAAGLYWQDFPNAKHNRKAWFYKRLYSWVLSSTLALRIEKQSPNRSTTVQFHSIKDDQNPASLLGFSGDWQKSLPDPAYYTYSGAGKFTTPNADELTELLTPQELAIIEKHCARWMPNFVQNCEHKGHYSFERGAVFIPLIMALSRLSPPLAHSMIDLLCLPVWHVTNRIDQLKQFIKDMRDFSS
jgi:hypothetical protein